MRKNIERLIPKKALADTLQIGPRALERLVNDGQLPAMRLNGRCIFRTTSLVGALPKFFVGVHLADRQKNTGFPKDWLTAVEVAERYQKSRATILR